MKWLHQWKVFLTLGLLGLMVTSACASEPVTPMVSVKATDYAFAVAETIKGGMTRLQLDNQGQESHHLQLMRLNDGVTQQQFQETLQSALQAVQTEGEGALARIFAVASFAGGPASIGPGKQAEAVVNIQPGEYTLLCFIPSPDGVPHLAKGMVKALAVTAASKDQPAEPESKATVSLGDFSFSGLPASFSPGKATIKVVNSGKEPHEMAVMRLKGITVEQFKGMMTAPPGGDAPSGPPPFEDVGGLQAISPNGAGWATLDLTAGEYALICFVPSPANQGAPHVALGMLGSFTVG